MEEEGGVKLEGLWKVRDEKCGEELINRIRNAVESTGHVLMLQFEAPNQVRAQLWTSSLGKEFILSLTGSDFRCYMLKSMCLYC